MLLHTSNNRRQRHNAAVAIRLSTRKYGGTPAMENIMYTLYKPGKSGTANNMKIEELRERYKNKRHSCSKEWTKAYKKGNESTNRTYRLVWGPPLKGDYMVPVTGKRQNSWTTSSMAVGDARNEFRRRLFPLDKFLVNSFICYAKPSSVPNTLCQLGNFPLKGDCVWKPYEELQIW